MSPIQQMLLGLGAAENDEPYYQPGGSLLYSFSNATFTNGGVTGLNGPTLAQAISGMSGSSANNFKNNINFFNVNNGQQYWTVPIDGTYQIQAAGAGMKDHRNGGYGAKMRGDFSLIRGQVIRILVGQTGPIGGGAAGGSFVVKSPYNSNASILVIAGGGGGGHGYGPYNNVDGQTGTSGGDAEVPSGSNGLGGTSGNGGSAADSGGGGGFFTDGTDTNGGKGGKAYVNGGYGGDEGYDIGGFGGGGTSGNSHGGGGGGYSGGGGSGGYPWHGGGGGSYNNGSNQQNQATQIPGNGAYVQIYKI